MSTVKFLLDVFDQSSDQIAIVNTVESIAYGELSLSVITCLVLPNDQKEGSLALSLLDEGL